MSVLSFVIPSSDALHNELLRGGGASYWPAARAARYFAVHGLPRTGHVLLLAEGLVTRLCDEELDAVIGHEFGHFACGHAGRVDDPLREELEADAVAARAVGAAALYSALCSIAGEAGALTHPHVVARLNALFALL